MLSLSLSLSLSSDSVACSRRQCHLPQLHGSITLSLTVARVLVTVPTAQARQQGREVAPLLRVKLSSEQAQASTSKWQPTHCNGWSPTVEQMDEKKRIAGVQVSQEEQRPLSLPQIRARERRNLSEVSRVTERGIDKARRLRRGIFVKAKEEEKKKKKKTRRVCLDCRTRRSGSGLAPATRKR